MPRGNDTQHRCHFKGKNEDFIVFVESAEAVRNWKADKSIPLAQVVDGWKASTATREFSIQRPMRRLRPNSAHTKKKTSSRRFWRRARCKTPRNRDATGARTTARVPCSPTKACRSFPGHEAKLHLLQPLLWQDRIESHTENGRQSACTKKRTLPYSIHISISIRQQ